MDPCLKKGATRAVFQLSGKCPTDRDQLNSCIREGGKISIPVFKKKLEIISVPNPFDAFTFEKAFKTFSLLSGENENELETILSPKSPLRRGFFVAGILSLRSFPMLQKSDSWFPLYLAD